MSQSQKWGKLERLITWRRLHSVARLPRVNAEALVKGYWAMRDWRDREIGWMLAVRRLMLHQNHCRTLWPVTSTMTNTAPSTDTFSTSWTQAVLAHALLTQSDLTQTTSFFNTVLETEPKFSYRSDFLELQKALWPEKMTKKNYCPDTNGLNYSLKHFNAIPKYQPTIRHGSMAYITQKNMQYLEV